MQTVRIEGVSLKDILAGFERDVILFALEKNGGNVAKTVQQLQIGKTALYEKLKRYAINPKELQEAPPASRSRRPPSSRRR